MAILSTSIQVGVIDGVRVTGTTLVGVLVLYFVAVNVRVGVFVFVGRRVLVGVFVLVGARVLVGVLVFVGTRVLVGVLVFVGTSVLVGVLVAVFILVGTAVAVITTAVLVDVAVYTGSDGTGSPAANTSTSASDSASRLIN
jgi:hypothetical protein